MTLDQIALARHALGLSQGAGKISYRNYFTAGVGHLNYRDWRGMVDAGYAIRFHRSGVPFGGNDLFRLTRAGAEAVLTAGETLSKEEHYP
jgi:hypothetical protein